jgi:hypothetical protein
MAKNSDLSGADKVIMAAIISITILVLGAVIVSTFSPATTTVIQSVLPAAITGIGLLAGRHPPRAPMTPAATFDDKTPET